MRSFSLFIEESKKIGNPEASQDELMTKLAQKASDLQADYKMRELLAFHDAQMESKLENVYDLDTVQDIKSEVEVHTYRKLQDFMGLLEKQRQNSRWSEQVKANHVRLETEISTCLSQAVPDYKSALDPSKFRTEDEMANVEPDSRSNALEALQQFSGKVSQTRMSSLRADLIARLDDINDKAREEVKNNAEIVEEQLESTIKEAAAEYKRSMVRLLSSESGAIRMEGKSSRSSLPSTR